ncbi:MAG: 2Fe-2S iron-sulfur cluster-binding protein [Burkholderiaceae bacterium]|nr:FAD-binding oxidoreductase [Oxalobacteraceae bacterium]
MSASAAEVVVRVSVEQGESFAAAATEDSLLRAALRAGIGFPHECSVGGCGACRFELLGGEVEDLWPEAPGLSERDRKRGKRLACQSRLRGDVRVKVRCDDSYRPVMSPRRQAFVLRQREMITHDMAELSFEAEDAVTFLPGQYALLYLPGVQGTRAYSMSNVADGSGLLQFIVRRTPDGKGTGVLVEGLAIGQRITIDGPYGHAYLREQVERPIVCIAGGSGLAPMLSVARRAAATMTKVPIDFFFGCRDASDLCADTFLKALPGFGDRLRLHNVVSEPAGDDWYGATGWVHDEVDRVIGDQAVAREFYFAGPPLMIESLQALLMVRRKVDFRQIHFDRFV